MVHRVVHGSDMGQHVHNRTRTFNGYTVVHGCLSFLSVLLAVQVFPRHQLGYVPESFVLRCKALFANMFVGDGIMSARPKPQKPRQEYGERMLILSFWFFGRLFSNQD